MRVDSSTTAPWARVADHGQKVGWQGRDLPPGQAKKQPAEATVPAPPAPAPAPPEPAAPAVPTTSVSPTDLPGVPEAPTSETPSDTQVDVLA